MGKVSPHDITPSDKDVPPESKDTNTGLAEGAANSGISQVSIEFTTEGLSVSKLFDTSPFNGRTLQVRNSSDGSGIVIRDLIKEGVIGTKLTDKNGYFIHGKKISGGLINGGIKYSDSSNYSKYKNGIARYIPYYMILPNCVGGARGRVKELGISKTFPYFSHSVFKSSFISLYLSSSSISNPLIILFKQRTFVGIITLYFLILIFFVLFINIAATVFDGPFSSTFWFTPWYVLGLPIFNGSPINLMPLRMNPLVASSAVLNSMKA